MNLKDSINYEKLSPEQKVIVDKWQVERQARSDICDALESKQMTMDEALMQLQALTPAHCEHGRHVVKHCCDCEDINRVLHPELFLEEDA